MSNGKIGLAPYINFEGRAREALAFYQNVLGGKVDLRAATGQGAGSRRAARSKGRLLPNPRQARPATSWTRSASTGWSRSTRHNVRLQDATGSGTNQRKTLVVWLQDADLLLRPLPCVPGDQ